MAKRRTLNDHTLPRAAWLQFVSHIPKASPATQPQTARSWFCCAVGRSANDGASISSKAPPRDTIKAVTPHASAAARPEPTAARQAMFENGINLMKSQE